MQNTPKLIARFYPLALGISIIAYIANILPFQSLLSLTMNNASTIANPHLFPSFDSNSAWDTRKLNNVLTKYAKPYPGGIELTVSSYCQISIAIRKRLVDTQSQIVASVGALQTCHSEETASNLSI